MSIADKISRLQTAKGSISSAISDKGVQVAATDGFEDFSAKIAEIQNVTAQNLADLKAAAESYDGVTVPLGATVASYPSVIDSIKPMRLSPDAFAAKISASSTYNVASNKHIRIWGSDHQEYTIQQWNALFEAAGYNKENMTVSPLGLVIDCNQFKQTYLFDRYEGFTYDVGGVTKGSNGKLQHSMYNYNQITAAGSGTDVVTGKGWAVTKDGDVFTLTEANTGCSWNMATNCGNIYSLKAFNLAERTNAMWVQNEWLRHRFAIDSGLTTTEADGTLGTIAILNASGNQAAVGEDMYFWIGGVNTGKLAKYNLNNLHGGSALLTQAIADAIYNTQKANGVNMSDTGVNSVAKPVLSPGSKGAECIAKDGKWLIITPYISYPNATVSGTNNIADSPFVYWLKYKGYVGLSEMCLQPMYANWSIVNAMRTYLTTKEGWTLPTIPTDDYIWTGVRCSSSNAWIVYLYLGGVSVNATYLRYYVCGASAL